MTGERQDLEIVPVERQDIVTFMEREWPPENVRRFGRYDPAMWEKRPGFLAAYDRGELAGAAEYYIRGGVAHLSELLVDSHHRGRGLGRALLARFEAFARAAGCHKLTLVTYADEQVIGFYRRDGFAVEALLPRDLHQADWVRMAKFIN